ncbi:hypothetical protein BDU57DRAFT_532086 [Ampelomyces quisqualis]|uniref:Uncharacterized protein n=1 Tax=Ampelomyces quisqualis TaxID=50730 RepID=A0A6A5QBN5_AMPQU|nr:hypothetical protein BDU57DRAFT_532086 [Ampelomyces quisqualis]
MATPTAVTTGPPRQQDKTNVFGRNSPSENICLPEGIPVTAVEFYTYLPNAQRNYNAIVRFVQAGVTQSAVEKIINYHRRWAKRPAHHNSICKIMQEAMREQGGHAGWTVSRHSAGNYSYPRRWNRGDLTLDNVRLWVLSEIPDATWFGPARYY